jgi:copper chaperone
MTTETTTIRVSGMTCGGCVRHVTHALRARPGVHEVEVSLAEGIARVTFDPAASTLEALRDAIREAGYEAA